MKFSEILALLVKKINSLKKNVLAFDKLQNLQFDNPSKFIFHKIHFLQI